MKKVYVGLSGGVDSSITAALLKKAGYDVVGAYMKNWSQDLPGFTCPWFEDYQDAKRVAVQLGIPFKMFDFETDYKQLVVDYMIDEYSAGRTPNPDIMCNQEIKFKLFLEAALNDGADLIATGHYAKTIAGRLYKATDTNKDQTYFLYRAASKALKRTLFPLGELKKTEVRELAQKYNLITAQKKESMGICFVGKVGIKDFLKQYVTTSTGPLVDQNGAVVGEHDGAIFYTIGQRHGLSAGGGTPYYVTGKNMVKNTVYVTTKLHDESLWKSQIELNDLLWINEQPQAKDKLQVRLRHRGPLIPVEALNINDTAVMSLGTPEKAISPGQSAVFYKDDEVMGGGFVAAT